MEKKNLSHTDALFKKSKILKFEHLLDLHFAQTLVEFKKDKLNWSIKNKLQQCLPNETSSTRSASHGQWKLPPYLNIDSLVGKFVKVYNLYKSMIEDSKGKKQLKSNFVDLVTSNYTTICTKSQCLECTV